MYSFQEGLRSLPVALAKRVEELGGKIQLNTTLTSLHTNKANNSNPHVLVSTHSSSSSSSSSPSSPSSYDHVVCTLSAKSLGKILSTSSSLLGNETDQNTLQKEDYARWRHLGEKMSKIDHASLALASVAFPTQLLKKRGFGVLLPRGGAGLDGVLGVIFLSDCFPGQMGDSKSTRLTVMMGGARDPNLVTLSQAQLEEKVLATLQRVLGITATPELIEINRVLNAIPQYSLGHEEFRESILTECNSLSNGRVRLIGTSFGLGVSVNQCISDALHLGLRLQPNTSIKPNK